MPFHARMPFLVPVWEHLGASGSAMFPLRVVQIMLGIY